ncbi:hypothetical protein ABEB36_007832 [Hypothenemus hampei]|uniref:GIY-YIG domain-containing protein n=1 Tax=Hypothenemus hampei TaxID=57062 RepID=A0ABD1EVA0_HYPHA
MNEPNIIENFHGVYLLYCLNTKYLGRTYIGYTVDPNRRIKQHNKGKEFGGAWKTSKRGPWSMVLIIHGFPNDISALRVGPWNRLPLTIQWLNEEFARDFPVQERPPMHMPICYGPVISKKLEKGNSISEHSPKSSQVEEQCYLCFTAIEPSKEITCVDPTCSITCHIICMSKHFLSPGQYVPVEGYCPKCFKHYLWGDIIRKFKGCYGNIDLSVQNILCCYEEN